MNQNSQVSENLGSYRQPGNGSDRQSNAYHSVGANINTSGIHVNRPHVMSQQQQQLGHGDQYNTVDTSSHIQVKSQRGVPKDNHNIPKSGSSVITDENQFIHQAMSGPVQSTKKIMGTSRKIGGIGALQIKGQVKFRRNQYNQLNITTQRPSGGAGGLFTGVGDSFPHMAQLINQSMNQKSPIGAGMATISDRFNNSTISPRIPGQQPESTQNRFGQNATSGGFELVQPSPHGTNIANVIQHMTMHRNSQARDLINKSTNVTSTVNDQLLYYANATHNTSDLRDRSMDVRHGNATTLKDESGEAMKQRMLQLSSISGAPGGQSAIAKNKITPKNLQLSFLNNGLTSETPQPQFSNYSTQNQQVQRQRQANQTSLYWQQNPSTNNSVKNQAQNMSKQSTITTQRGEYQYQTQVQTQVASQLPQKPNSRQMAVQQRGGLSSRFNRNNSKLQTNSSQNAHKQQKQAIYTSTNGGKPKHDTSHSPISSRSIKSGAAAALMDSIQHQQQQLLNALQQSQQQQQILAASTGQDMQQFLPINFSQAPQITPKQQLINVTQSGWNNQTNINIINTSGMTDPNIYMTNTSARRGVNHLKDIYVGTNTYRGNETVGQIAQRKNSQFKQQRQVNQVNSIQPTTISEFTIPQLNMSINGMVQLNSQTPKRHAPINFHQRDDSNTQQKTQSTFPPVSGIQQQQTDNSIGLNREQLQLKRASNRTTIQQDQMHQTFKLPESSAKMQQLIMSDQTTLKDFIMTPTVAQNITLMHQFPISGADASRVFAQTLTPFEREEIKGYDHVYYLNLSKKTPSSKVEQVASIDPAQTTTNNGFDSEDGDFLYEMGDQINYRYEVVKKLGRGAFGVVIRCIDHLTPQKEQIALKILKNKKKLHKQGKIEIKILEMLRNDDPEDKRNIVVILDSFTFRNHVCISFEMLSLNLYQFIKNNDFQGFSIALTKRFAIQLLVALQYLFKYSIVHCDLKPENVLLSKPNKSKVKLIDFGSSCFEDERYYTYIQSRFYRAPEIMLGIAYTTAIDMWSLGCIVFECLVGIPLFAGENERDQMLAIMEVTGLPPRSLIASATRRKVFFDDDYNPIIKANSRGKVRKPGSKPLDLILKVADPDLVSFLTGCFEWKPEKRLKPHEALSTPWILKAITESRLTKNKQQSSDRQSTKN